MILLLRLLFTGIALFIYLSFFLENYDDRENSIIYKLYLFTFMFLLQIIINILNNVINKEKISINVVTEIAINNALLSVIAYDTFNDLIYKQYYKGYTKQQKTFTLVFLIIGFIATVKLLQLLLSQ